jgi:hypothetical protein
MSGIGDMSDRPKSGMSDMSGKSGMSDISSKGDKGGMSKLKVRKYA